MHETIYAPDYYILEHHGILGQKWGVRRYQNKDGSFTAAGRSRYAMKDKAGTQHHRNRHKSKTAASGRIKHPENIRAAQLTQLINWQNQNRAMQENIRTAHLIEQNNRINNDMMLANISEANRASAIGVAASQQFLYSGSPAAPYPHTVYGNYLTYG